MICEYLFLLEDLLSEANFEFDDGLLVNDPILWSAVVDEEFLVVNLYSFASFDIAHESAEKERVQVRLLYLLEGLCLSLVCSLILLISCPNWRNSKNLYWLGGGRVNLDISRVEINAAEERSRVLDIELVLLELEDLIFVHIEIGILLKERFYRGFKNGGARIIKATQGH